MLIPHIKSVLVDRTKPDYTIFIIESHLTSFLSQILRENEDRKNINFS